MSPSKFSPNTATLACQENRRRGLMICGYNWGSSKKDLTKSAQQEDRKSFFSDSGVNNYPYRNRIATWFDLWGHALISEQGSETGFEKSIIQTNWCPDQGNNNNGLHVRQCLHYKDNFFHHVKFYQPAIIMLMGIGMFDLLSEPDLKEDVKSALGGCVETPRVVVKEGIKQPNGNLCRKFRVGFGKYETCEVIGLPHPTSSKGLSNNYILGYKNEIGYALARYKSCVVEAQKNRDSQKIS